jgi:hypothetical protein
LVDELPRARIEVFDDGALLFDPVSWQFRTMAPESLDLLEMLRELIESGCTDRGSLMDRLLLEAGPGDPAENAVQRDSGRVELADWVDLARHLYA